MKKWKKQLDPVGGRIGPEKEDEGRERDGLKKKMYLAT